MTQPELDHELKGQVEKSKRATRVTTAPARDGELPHTGFPAWIAALIGFALLATSVGLRILTRREHA